jgi:HEAT repeat protein
VPTSPRRGKLPRRSIEDECNRRGQAAVVAGCIDLLAGREADNALIFALGGRPARWALEGGDPGPDYWLRVWGARGLLWAWSDEALPSILNALRDDAWRVREMAVKVVTRHELDAALAALSELQQDPNARVRKAAERALHRLAGAGH